MLQKAFPTGGIFPLTPALSQRERELYVHVFGEITD